MNRLVISAIAAAIVSFSAPVGAASTSHLDSATITKTGSGAKSVILIPGLGCGPFVFDGVADELAQRYTVYRIAFDGFDGNGGASAPYLAHDTQSVVDLIAREHLVRPILIGHSFGGHIALALAETIPTNVGAVVAIDALPLFPLRRPGQTDANRQDFARGFVAQMMSAPEEQYRAFARQSVAALVTGDTNTDLVFSHTIRSDRAAFAGAAADMMTDDLGPALKAIAAPVLVLAPSPDAVAADAICTTYRALFAGVSRLRVQTIAPARHFLMLDQPASFRMALDTFVDANAR
jgi:pimeloyl-ACP methyl ester carboxylesterase